MKYEVIIPHRYMIARHKHHRYFNQDSFPSLVNYDPTQIHRIIRSENIYKTTSAVFIKFSSNESNKRGVYVSGYVYECELYCGISFKLHSCSISSKIGILSRSDYCKYIAKCFIFRYSYC